MTDKELCDLLGISRDELKDLIAAGLPHEGKGRKRRFDAAAVRAWLLETGRAERPLQTIGEVARSLGVHKRTIQNWKAAGCPGLQRPPYYESEVLAWREAEARSVGDGDPDAKARAQAELTAVRAERERLHLGRERGDLVRRSEMRRVWQRHIREARAHLESLPALLVRECGGDSLPEKKRKRIRQRVQRAVDRAQDSLARWFESIAEAIERDEVPDD